VDGVAWTSRIADVAAESAGIEQYVSDSDWHLSGACCFDHSDGNVDSRIRPVVTNSPSRYLDRYHTSLPAKVVTHTYTEHDADSNKSNETSSSPCQNRIGYKKDIAIPLPRFRVNEAWQALCCVLSAGLGALEHHRLSRPPPQLVATNMYHSNQGRKFGPRWSLSIAWQVTQLYILTITPSQFHKKNSLHF
jgi:hypothetical protein